MSPPAVALVSTLPPDDAPWSAEAAQVANALAQAGQLGGCFARTPYQVSPGAAGGSNVVPACDLVPMLQSGDVEIPVYLLADDERCFWMLPWIARCPGVLVLANQALPTLRDMLYPEIAGSRKLFLEELEGAPGLESDPDGSGLANWLKEQSAGNLEARPGDGSLAAKVQSAVEKLNAKTLRSVIPRVDRPRPKVEAIVIGYNSRDIIAPCLQTLVDQDYPNLTVTVIDNDSKDGTAQFVRENFPTIRVVDSGSNLGFSGANNMAFREGDADWFVLLNQDAFGHRDFITELVRVAEADPNAGAVGAKMLFWRCPTLLNSTGIEINEGGWAWDRQVGERDANPSPLPEEVFGGCGGALMLSGKALKELGGFDEAFFMYFEDTDLAWRFLSGGYRNWYAPLSVVRHDFHGDGGATPGRELRRRYMSERNRLQMFIKNADRKHLKEVWPRIKKHERGRMQWMTKAIREGNNVEQLTSVRAIVKKAWRWNRLRLPSLMLRRFRIQKMRKVDPQSIRRFMVPGVNEGGHQGDVDQFHDRHSATPRQKLAMGDTDAGTIGTGWHVVEAPPGSVQPYRWCRDVAWFYLQPEPGAQSLRIKTASPIEPHAAEFFCEGQKLGAEEVGGEVRELVFPIPDSLPRGEILEFRIETAWYRPADHNGGGDIRQLGLIVFEAEVS